MPQDSTAAPIENQENLIIKNTFDFENNEKISNVTNLKNGKVSFSTPSAKNVLTNRKILAEKTPNNHHSSKS